MNSDPGVIGRTVGRYEILRQLGQGAMATVYLARQPDLDRAVALKELDRFGAGESPVFASRFLREARLAGSLSHANIVTVYEYFEHEGRPYIAMEHAEGGSLREYLLAGLSLTQIIGVLEGLLAALTHAEARGIVHRDIKPENILVTADGHIKIADFGIAKAYSILTGALLTATGSTVGTPMYMAPEQATGRPLSIATDLYAVGIVAFEMLFGYVPFASGDSPLAIIWQHVNEPVPDAHALRPDLDPRLCRWLERLLAKDAADRPASATAALNELEDIADELLGSRWRREAPLLARAAPEPDAPPPDSPPEHRRQTSIDGHDRAPAASGSARADATRDAGGTTIVPRELRERTEHYGRPHRDRSADDVTAPVPRTGWSPNLLAVVVAAMLVAGGGGYLAFHRDAAPPPAVKSQPPTAESAASKRFAAGLARAFERLNGIRVSARKQMAAARTARRQALQARAIASAYRAAAVAVNRLTPTDDQRAAVALLGDKLARAGAAYDALGAAAVARRRYDARRYAVGVREDAVKRAAERVDGAGKAPG